LNTAKLKKQVSLTVVRFHFLLLLLIAAVIADGLITEFLVNYGIGKELNPFLQNVLADGNLILIKIIGALLSALILEGIYRRQPKMAMVTTYFFIAVYGGIIYWNIIAMIMGASTLN
jgi:hypothetical protein